MAAVPPNRRRVSVVGGEVGTSLPYMPHELFSKLPINGVLRTTLPCLLYEVYRMCRTAYALHLGTTYSSARGWAYSHLQEQDARLPQHGPRCFSHRIWRGPWL